MARADTAMYAAKRSGKSRIVAHRPGMTLSELEDQRLRTVLLTAIGTGEIQLAYQPIVELASRRAWRSSRGPLAARGPRRPPRRPIAHATRTGVCPSTRARWSPRPAPRTPSGQRAVRWPCTSTGPVPTGRRPPPVDGRTLVRRHGLTVPSHIRSWNPACSPKRRPPTTTYERYGATASASHSTTSASGTPRSAASRISSDSVNIDRSSTTDHSQPRNAMFLSDARFAGDITRE